jgi:DDE superfamily endonuclease
VIPRAFPPAPGWSPGGHRVKAPPEYSRGPEKTRACGGLRVTDGRAVTLCAPSRNSSHYQRFLQQAEDANPHGQIVIITGNLSSHDSKSTRAWLENHPRIRHAFIPKRACWLNLQEGWWRIFRVVARISECRWARHTAEMGSSYWSYVAPYTGDAATSLRALQERLIRDRDYWHWEGYPGTELQPWPETVEELWDNEDYWYSGSHSILDIQRVVDTTRPPSDSHHNDDYSTVRPLSRDRLRRLFGTEKPTPAQFEAPTTDRQHPDYDAFWFEERVRWTGHYVLLYADREDTPAEIGFWGDSGD